MGRIARVVAAKYPHHVTPRGNRRQDTFFCEDDELLISIPSCHVTNNYNCTLKQSVLRLRFL
jgi:putative transposase